MARMRVILRCCYSALTGLGLLSSASAAAEISLSLGSVRGAGWLADAVQLQLADAEIGNYRLMLDASRLSLPGPLGRWSNFRLRCDALQLADDAYRCPALQVDVDTPQGKQRLSGSLAFSDVEHWSVHLDGVRLAEGRWSLQASADGRWQARLQAKGVTPAGVLALLPGQPVPAWQWVGGLTAQVDAQGHGTVPDQMAVSLKLAKGGWSSADGLQAAESLVGSVTLKAHHKHGVWQGQFATDWTAGQVYSDPLYLEVAQHPLRIRSDFRWQGYREPLQLAGVSLRLGKLLAVSGSARLPLDAPAMADAELRMDVPELAVVYPVLMQPFVYGGALGALQLTGNLDARVTLRQGVPSVAVLQLSGVQFDDERDRFGLHGLTGILNWRAAGEPAETRLQWQGGHLYQVNFGASKVDLALLGDSLAFSDALVLPMLEGQLRIPQLSGTGLRGDTPIWKAALRAESLSLPALSAALGWPTLAGDLSVEIPAVHFADGVLALDGELLASAFGGEVRVTGLQLRQPFSPAPMLLAEASLRDLNLERLTGVFDFGRITGQLEGEVRDLQLVAWEPVAFQAVLQSPMNDALPHRISQRAVENLTALGNGGVVALSGTFLRFFESFTYDRLMLKVNLSGQRAELDGIAHANGGYYLVKGAGLPRIDVIGRNRNVAWRDLVERLRRIQLKGAEAP